MHKSSPENRLSDVTLPCIASSWLGFTLLTLKSQKRIFLSQWPLIIMLLWQQKEIKSDWGKMILIPKYLCGHQVATAGASKQSLDTYDTS